MTKNQSLEDAYVAAHADALRLAEKVQRMIEDQPAPGGKTRIGWDDVGTLRHCAARLEELLESEDDGN
ncbi:MAG: hypothetical protein WBD31_00935 [Rubripirellula sp.]|jgi:hypothetical protein